jgi:uncharacterized protein (TIGR02391 family)
MKWIINRDWEFILNGVLKVLSWLQAVSIIATVAYSLWLGISRGKASGTLSGFVTWLLASLIVSFLMLALFAAINLGEVIWEDLHDWLTDRFGRYPTLRKWIIAFPAVLSGVTTPLFLIFADWQVDIFVKVMVLAYFGLVLPSALVSLVRSDMMRWRTHLTSANITPELIAQSPQAAIENAFTHFEDKLRRRIGVGPDVFGEALINRAFAPQNGALIYGAVEAEQQGVRNLVSGAYATFRNPRKHRVIQDDVAMVEHILTMVEVLMRLTDEAQDRRPAPAPNPGP